MAVKKLYCPRCQTLVGAEDSSTGEHEYIGGARYWNDLLYCKDCYNAEVVDRQEFMGGIDEIVL